MRLIQVHDYVWTEFQHLLVDHTYEMPSARSGAKLCVEMKKIPHPHNSINTYDVVPSMVTLIYSLSRESARSKINQNQMHVANRKVGEMYLKRNEKMKRGW